MNKKIMNKKIMNKKKFSFFLVLFSFSLEAQKLKNNYSFEIGYSHNAINFFGGDPYSVAVKGYDRYNYSVKPISGFHIRGGFETKIYKNLKADINLGYLRSGYQGRHLDSFYFLPTAPNRDSLFIRSEKWTDYRVNSLTTSIGLNCNIKNKIILRGAFLFQLPLWVDEKTDLVKLYEFVGRNSFDNISKETTGRFREPFVGWEFSTRLHIWRKFYLSIGYQHLFENGMQSLYYNESERAPHFRKTLFAGLYCDIF